MIPNRREILVAGLAARVVARDGMLSFVRSHRPERPLPRVAGLAPTDRLRAEDENIGICLEYAREHL